MKKAIKRIAGRIFIIILTVFALYLLISNIGLFRDLVTRKKVFLVIDSDAANGSDDVFSLLRILQNDAMDLKAILSAQWRLADLDNDSTVSSNQKVHRFLLAQYPKSGIPQFEGASLPLLYRMEKMAGSSVAGTVPGKNHAADAIVKIVRELPPGEKLNLLCLGAATNLAEAIQEHPEISDEIICFIQGPRYYSAGRTWQKNDPVSRLDLDAMDMLLNDPHLEMHLLPANVSDPMVLTRTMLLDGFSEKDTLYRFILERSKSSLLDSDTIPCPSLALAETFLNPELATGRNLITPPENTQRKIHVYTQIDVDHMARDFIKSVRRNNK